MSEQVGDALLSVIEAAQRQGCRGCCTSVYRWERARVRDAMKRGDEDMLARLAATYGGAE